MSDKKNLDQLSNDQLGSMFAPLPYRETDPMESRNQLGMRIFGVIAAVFGLWLLSTVIFH